MILIDKRVIVVESADQRMCGRERAESAREGDVLCRCDVLVAEEHDAVGCKRCFDVANCQVIEISRNVHAMNDGSKRARQRLHAKRWVEALAVGPRRGNKGQQHGAIHLEEISLPVEFR